MGAHEMKQDLEAAIHAALTDEWQTSREIWTKMGAWSESYVGQRLALLTSSGEVESQRRGLKGAAGYVMIFRKVQHANQT